MSKVPFSGEDPYATIVEFYDLEHDEFEEDVAMLAEIAGDAAAPIVEMGAGTGRVLAALADSGLNVVGLDSSTPMLDAARQRFAALELEKPPQLIQARMTEITALPAESAGLVAFTLSALFHLDTQDDQLRALRAAAAWLRPDGLLFIDVMHAHPEQLGHLNERTYHEGSWTRTDGAVIDKWSYRTVDHVDQLVHTTIWYDVCRASGEIRRFRTQFDLRYVHASELRLLVGLAGFGSVVLYGGYDFQPFDEGAERLIVVARKTHHGAA